MGWFSRFLRWCCGCFGIKKGSSIGDMGSFYFWKRFPSRQYFLKYIAREAYKGTQGDVYGYSTLLDCRRKIPVKETNVIVKTEDSNGSKMINEYVRECRIGTGSYGKVVLHRNTKDGNLYALKVLHKYRLSKVRVAPTETALTDVLREVEIMKTVEHPNIVKSGQGKDFKCRKIVKTHYPTCIVCGRISLFMCNNAPIPLQVSSRGGLITAFIG